MSGLDTVSGDGSDTIGAGVDGFVAGPDVVLFCCIGRFDTGALGSCFSVVTFVFDSVDLEATEAVVDRRR